MTHVIACIDRSSSTAAVCDYAAWSSQRLTAPLTLLHVLDQQQYPDNADLSGNIGLGSREQLLAELVSLDGQRAKLALEQGRTILAAATERVVAAGGSSPQSKQRHGDLLDSLCELESDTRLLVIGRQGEASSGLSQHVGSQLESVTRVVQRPILITPADFKQPSKVMVAFDASATIIKSVELLASSPLLNGLPIHLVMVGPVSDTASKQLNWAQQLLTSSGFTTQTDICHGEVEPTLRAYLLEHDIDLLVMGAHGHSRLRQFLLGSTTDSMLRTASSAILLLR